MEALRKILNKVTEWISIFIMGAMVLLVTWQVITRFVLRDPSTITEQLARYGFVWLVVINAAYVFGQRGHMNIGFVVGKFSESAQKILAIIAELLILVFMVVVMIWGGMENVQVGMTQLDSALPIMMGYLYLALPISGVITIIYSILNIHDLIVGIKRK